MPQHAPDDRYVGAGADAHVVIGMGRRAREAWINHDEFRPAFLSVKHMLQGNGMCLGRVTPADQDRLAMADVVHGVGHRTVTPCVGYPGDRRRVANTRLVVTVVAAPHRVELTEQISLLVVELRRA